MYGYVSERDSSSRISASQTIFEIDFDVMTDDVFGATCTALPPASWCWPFPANAIDSTSPCACSPISQIDGYLDVTFEPRFPSTHSIVAPSYATDRFVT